MSTSMRIENNILLHCTSVCLLILSEKVQTFFWMHSLIAFSWKTDKQTDTQISLSK